MQRFSLIRFIKNFFEGKGKNERKQRTTQRRMKVLETVIMNGLERCDEEMTLGDVYEYVQSASAQNHNWFEFEYSTVRQALRKLRQSGKIKYRKIHEKKFVNYLP